jgi:hypothetical protein
MSSSDSLAVFDVSGKKIGPVSVKGIDVVFPDPAIRWVWVLDARCEPYPELERSEVFSRARQVRKRYVLMPDSAAG